MNWFIGIVVLVVVGFLLDREIYFYEGVHLGPRVQAWLYDRWSRHYDEGKRGSQLWDDEMLAEPLLEAMRDVPAPFVLDFATGTGRLSLALVRRPEFRGHILALDLSLGMLEKAVEKIYGQVEPEPARARVEFLRHRDLPLPFPDAAFDAVCALEVLELFPSMDEPLAEFSRVLRPGGVLLTSRGTEASGRRAKVRSEAHLTSLLEGHGFENVRVTRWWKLFDRVLARKRGLSKPVENEEMIDVLQCSSCGRVQWEREHNSLRCRNCGREVIVSRVGIVLNQEG